MFQQRVDDIHAKTTTVIQEETRRDKRQKKDKGLKILIYRHPEVL